MKCLSTKIDHLILIPLLSVALLLVSSATASCLISMPFVSSGRASLAPPDINTVLMKSTFKIVGDNGRFGTVFIIGKRMSDKPEEKRAYYVLTTAAHVLDQMSGDSAIIFFRTTDGDTYIKAPCRYQIRSGNKPLWVKHPKADVAAMFIRPPKDNGIELVASSLLSNDQMLEDFDIYPGREIKVIGFPLGTESNSAGFPVLRTGSIASFPLIPAEREKTFLVDFRVFEGNSGGPVYFYDPNWYKRQSGEGPRQILVAHGGVELILGLVSEQVSVTETTQSYLQEVKQKYPISLAEVVHGKLIKETIDLLPDEPTPETTSVVFSQMTFLQEAVTRLKEVAPSQSIDRVKVSIGEWERVPIEGNWVKASETVTFEAAKYNISSTITVSSLPKNGASIKYQTVGKRYRNEQAVTVGQTTRCTLTVPIGLYHIWAERGGKPTSDRNSVFSIVNSNQTIEITEYASPGNRR